MQYTKDEMIRLASAEFNAVLAADPELLQLEQLRYDRSAESRLLLEVMGAGDFRIGNLPVRPLTVAKWAFLWMLSSPFVCGGHCGESDLDIVLYVMSVFDLRDIPCAVASIPGAASNYRFATGLDNDTIVCEIRQTIRTSMLPLEMLPEVEPSDEPARYDADWLIRIATIAAKELRTPFDDCLHRISLGTVTAAYVNYLRRESVEGNRIRRRPSAEIVRLIDARIEVLQREFLQKIPPSKA